MGNVLLWPVVVARLFVLAGSSLLLGLAANFSGKARPHLNRSRQPSCQARQPPSAAGAGGGKHCQVNLVLSGS
jgi:hypothetical protein